MQNVTMQPNVEALQAQQGTPQGADVSAFANQNINLEATPAADTLELTPQEQPKKSKKGLLIGLGAAALATVAGVLIFKNTSASGKIQKMLKEAQGMADDAKKLADGIDDKVVSELKDKGTKLAQQADDDIVKVLQNKGVEFIDDTEKLSAYIDDAANGFKSIKKDESGNIIYEFAKQIGEGDKAVEHIYSGTINKGFGSFDVADSVDDIMALVNKSDKGIVLDSVASGKDNIFCNFKNGALSGFGTGLVKENGKIAKITDVVGVSKVDGKYQADTLCKNVDISGSDAEKVCYLKSDGTAVGYADFTKVDNEDDALNSFSDNIATVNGQDYELKDGKWKKVAEEKKD